MTCTSEAGMVVAGSVDSTIEGLVLDNVGIELVQQTDFAGGFLDYRPGMRGIVDNVQTSAIFIEFANHVNLSSVEVGLLLGITAPVILPWGCIKWVRCERGVLHDCQGTDVVSSAICSAQGEMGCVAGSVSTNEVASKTLQAGSS